MRWLLSGSVLAQSLFFSALGCAERPASVQVPPSESSANPLPARSIAAEVASPGPSASTAPVESVPRDPLRATNNEAPVEAASPPAPEAEPPLTTPDGKPLPQTEARPSVDSPAFKSRIERLAQCIIQDDPSLCRSSFFPLLAYREVKAIEKPERDYQYRLIRHFERDIHEYRKALGANAKFEGVDVPESSARWMKPGSEGNKLGYFRVLRSRLRFTKGNGKSQSVELTSMISWRGEWYVVHLHGFE